MASVRGLISILKLSYNGIASIIVDRIRMIVMTYLGFEKDLFLGDISVTSIDNANNVWKLLLNVANSCPQDAFTTTSCIAVETKGE